jgi:hypothetical protein
VNGCICHPFSSTGFHEDALVGLELQDATFAIVHGRADAGRHANSNMILCMIRLSLTPFARHVEGLQVDENSDMISCRLS